MKSDKYLEILYTKDDIEQKEEDFLMKILNNEEFMERSANKIKKFIDGEPVNKDPLTEIPNPEMRLYGIYDTYFETKEELESFCQNKNFSMNNIYTLDYFKYFAGRSDVIRKTSKDNSVFYTAIDEDGYAKYNYERSVYKGKVVWEYNYGEIREMYNAFKDKGITLEKDIYDQIDENYNQLLKKLYK